MAKDDRSADSPRSVGILGWLVLGLAALTGYAIWQIAPLTARVDALERDRLATRDETLAQLDQLETRIASGSRPLTVPAGTSEPAPSAENQAPTAGAAPAATAPAARVAPPPAPAEPPREALEFLDHRLFPADAVIARLMVGNTAPENIARLTNHSRAYVIARCMQIEKLVSAAPNVPTDIARALRAYVREHGAREP